jgi:predicted phosphodiesterase
MTGTAPIAVLADIHGNRWALDAVLADARRAGARRFVDLGDCVAGPLDPRGTAERLMVLGALTVRGNHDRAMLEGDDGASNRFARDKLDGVHLDWLGSLPATANLDGVLLCHGTPSDDTTYLLEEIVGGTSRPRGPKAVRALLGDVAAPLVLCAHTHLSRVLPLPDGTVVANPGSVGLPAYDDDAPPHVMESGSPHARYALLHQSGERWQVEPRTIAYDWTAAAAVARAHDREDWAVAIETGLALPTIERA